MKDANAQDARVTAAVTVADLTNTSGHLPWRSVLDSGYPNRRGRFVMTITRLYSVPGMSCDNCVNIITDHVTPLDGVTDLEFDLDARTVTITGGDDAAITAAIDGAGFVIR